jgi:hypothetical protein
MCDPITVIASFRNAGITLRLELNRLTVCCVNIDQCHCLFNSMEVMAIAASGGADTGDTLIDGCTVETVSGREGLQIFDDESVILFADEEDDGLVGETIMITFLMRFVRSIGGRRSCLKRVEGQTSKFEKLTQGGAFLSWMGLSACRTLIGWIIVQVR